MTGSLTTQHRVHLGDARSMPGVRDDSIACVVTSPPYPMIEMWDEVFQRLDPRCGDGIAEGDGNAAFEAQHEVLDMVWDELARVVLPGGFVCINIGDATRKIGDRFRLYPNHARIQQALGARGFDLLPSILWRKSTNAPNKFMGSGVLPAGAYVTLEHEHILIARKGDKRTFDAAARKRRTESAFFWEERNAWFSDVWNLAGQRQGIEDPEVARRSAAYPFTLPYRLIQMYSLIGDTVLDPFGGTGTTAAAALASGRNSLSMEIDPDFQKMALAHLQAPPDHVREAAQQRLHAHAEFVAQRTAAGKTLAHHHAGFDVPVVTRQETNLTLWEPGTLEGCNGDTIRWTHRVLKSAATTPTVPAGHET